MTDKEVDNIQVGDKVILIATITDKFKNEGYVQATVGEETDWAFLPHKLKQGILLERKNKPRIGDVVMTEHKTLAFIDKVAADGEFVHLDFEPKDRWRKARSLILIMSTGEYKARISALLEEGGEE